MNKIKIQIAMAFVIVSLMAAVGYMSKRLDRMKAEKNLYKNNVNVLLDDIKTYKVKDSLNVASIGVIELRLSEYKKYRAEDMEVIKSLNIDKKRLQQITTSQSKTIYELKGSVRDSIIYRDNIIIDTLRCLDITDKWFDLHGCLNKSNQFTGTFINRDSLVYVEHIVPKRFLFFRWGVKQRKQEIFSRNPNTVIINAEYISIRK